MGECGNVSGRIYSQLLVLIFFDSVPPLGPGPSRSPHVLEGFTQALLHPASCMRQGLSKAIGMNPPETLAPSPSKTLEPGSPISRAA